MVCYGIFWSGQFETPIAGPIECFNLSLDLIRVKQTIMPFAKFMCGASTSDYMYYM